MLIIHRIKIQQVFEFGKLKDSAKNFQLLQYENVSQMVHNIFFVI